MPTRGPERGVAKSLSCQLRTASSNTPAMRETMQSRTCSAAPAQKKRGSARTETLADWPAWTVPETMPAASHERPKLANATHDSGLARIGSPFCKTSTPGSNPGGASKFTKHHYRSIVSTYGCAQVSTGGLKNATGPADRYCTV